MLQGNSVQPTKEFFEFIEDLFRQAPFSQSAIYKEIFIQAVFSQDNREALCKAERKPSLLRLILDTLEKVGCFAEEQSKQAFINGVCRVDTSYADPQRGGSPLLYSAAYYGNQDSLQLIFDKLKLAGCFDGPHAAANKKTFINAIFAHTTGHMAMICGDSVLSRVCDKSNKDLLDLLFHYLALAGCFDGPPGNPHQQAFIEAVLAEDKYGNCALYYALSPVREKLLNQLTKVQYFEGPSAETNKNAFIRAVLTQNRLNGESVLYRCVDDLSTITLINHLTTAGCFAGPAGSPHKKAFIAAVFALSMIEKNILSRLLRRKLFSLFLKKLEEAGCFDNVTDRANFIKAVCAQDNECLFRATAHLSSYLDLHNRLLQAGCSSKDIEELLNQAVTRHYGGFSFPTTPLMEIWYKNTFSYRTTDSVLVEECLELHGAKLTEIQRGALIEKYRCSNEQQSQEEKGEEAKFDREKFIAQKLIRYKQPTLTSPWRGLTLFSTIEERSGQRSKGQKRLIADNTPRRGSWSGPC